MNSKSFVEYSAPVTESAYGIRLKKQKNNKSTTKGSSVVRFVRLKDVPRNAAPGSIYSFNPRRPSSCRYKRARGIVSCIFIFHL